MTISRNFRHARLKISTSARHYSSNSFCFLLLSKLFHRDNFVKIQFFIVSLHFGFKDKIDIPKTLLEGLRKYDISLDPMRISYFLLRNEVALQPSSHLANWRLRLFAWMQHNASNAAHHYQIPLQRMIEVGLRFRL